MATPNKRNGKANGAETADTPIQAAQVEVVSVPKKPETLIGKLAGIMAEVDHVEKRGYNSNQKYEYVKAADLARAFRNKLAEHGLLMVSNVVNVGTWEKQGRDSLQRGVDLTVEYTIHDSVTGESLSFKGFGSGLDSGDKAAYKAHTGALKYALRSLFMVPDEASDPEADEETDKQNNGKGAEVKPARRAESAPQQGEKKPNGSVISDAQRQRLFAIARSAGADEAKVKAVIAKYGFDSTKAITPDKYDSICNELGAGTLKVVNPSAEKSA